MGVKISPDLEVIVQSVSRRGRCDDESVVLREALPLLRQRDQLRYYIRETIALMESRGGHVWVIA